MDMKLGGRTVLITGASGGIGSAMVRRFAAEGASVVVHYRTGRERALRLVRETGSGALAVRGDLTREGDVKRVFATAVKRFGRVDTLVVNAGNLCGGSPKRSSEIGCTWYSRLAVRCDGSDFTNAPVCDGADLAHAGDAALGRHPARHRHRNGGQSHRQSRRRV